MSDFQQIFIEIGGEFANSPFYFKQRLAKTKAFLFDWDGVFNNGFKSGDEGSPFSETDSMGANLLRFSYWMKYRSLPYVAIITGENNQAGLRLARREHFHTVFLKMGNKIEALNKICKEHNLVPLEVAYVFDDVLDLPIAKVAGLRFLINRPGSPMLHRYMDANNLYDYKTATTADQHAVREVAELIMAATGNFDQVMRERLEFSDLYKQYLDERNAIETKVFTTENRKIIAYKD